MFKLLRGWLLSGNIKPLSVVRTITKQVFDKRDGFISLLYPLMLSSSRVPVDYKTHREERRHAYTGFAEVLADEFHCFHSLLVTELRNCRKEFGLHIYSAVIFSACSTLPSLLKRIIVCRTRRYYNLISILNSVWVYAEDYELTKLPGRSLIKSNMHCFHYNLY